MKVKNFKFVVIDSELRASKIRERFFEEYDLACEFLDRHYPEKTTGGFALHPFRDGLQEVHPV